MGKGLDIVSLFHPILGGGPVKRRADEVRLLDGGRQQQMHEGNKLSEGLLRHTHARGPNRSAEGRPVGIPSAPSSNASLDFQTHT